jgi:hypothetical protein
MANEKQDYEDSKDLYMEFGRTAEIAQVMEVEAGNLALAFAALAFDPATITDDIQAGVGRKHSGIPFLGYN